MNSCDWNSTLVGMRNEVTCDQQLGKWKHMSCSVGLLEYRHCMIASTGGQTLINGDQTLIDNVES